MSRRLLSMLAIALAVLGVSSPALAFTFLLDGGSAGRFGMAFDPGQTSSLQSFIGGGVSCHCPGQSVPFAAFYRRLATGDMEAAVTVPDVRGCVGFEARLLFLGAQGFLVGQADIRFAPRLGAPDFQLFTMTFFQTGLTCEVTGAPTVSSTPTRTP